MLLKINEKDWADIRKAFTELNISLPAHQNIANLLNTIESQCKVNETDIPPSNKPNLRK